MAEPLYKSDIVKVENRTAMTTLADDDNILVHDTSESKIKKITKTNLKEDLGINDKANSADVANALADKQDKAITIDEQATTVESAIQANFDSIEDLQNDKQPYDTVSYATNGYVGGRLLETKNDVYQIGYELLTKAFGVAYDSNALKVYLDLGSGYVIGTMSFNSTSGNIEILVDSTTYTYTMDDDTALTTQTYLRVYNGLLRGTDDYIDLRYDLPTPVALFDGSNARNILRESGGVNYLANLKDIVNDNDAVQATETSQPSVDEDGIISFDGVDDRLNMSVNFSDLTQAWWFACKFNLSSIAGAKTFFVLTDLNNLHRRLRLDYSSEIALVDGVINNIIFTTSILADTYYSLILNFDGLNYHLYINGLEVSSYEDSSISYASFGNILGNTSEGTTSLGGFLYKPTFGSGILTTNQIQVINNYIGA